MCLPISFWFKFSALKLQISLIDRLICSAMESQIEVSGPTCREDLSEISLIVQHLYLGSFKAATTASILREHKIRHVLSVFTAREAIPPQNKLDSISYKLVEKNDIPGEDMMLSFGEVVQHLSKTVQSKENILVHCHMGVSRSVTMVAAYLMTANRWTTDRTLAFIKSHRSQANPNFGFKYQLKLYERMNFRLDANMKEFRLYILNFMTFRNYADGFHQNLREYLLKMEELERMSKLTIKAGFRCSQCNKTVFTDLNTLQGKVSNPEGTGTSGKGGGGDKCKYYLIEPIVWMLKTGVGEYLFANFPANSNGRIPCPHCNVTIGKFKFHIVQTELCGCTEHRNLQSFLSLEIHRDTVYKKTFGKKGFIARLFG